MKRMFSAILFLLEFFIAFPLSAQFDPSLISYLEDLDNKILMKGQTLTQEHIHDVWGRLDPYVIKALNELNTPEKSKKSQKENQANLDKDFQWEKVTYTLKKGEEIDEIELGAVQINFYPLGSHEWLVVYYHGVGLQPTSTFHVFKQNKQKIYELKETMEGLLPKREDLSNIERTALQVQFIPKPPESITTRFSTLHQLPAQGSRSNRSQIVWEKEAGVKPVFWFPQVDWHTVEGQFTEGRGPGEPLQ
ncbi:MAG: hypothetical protein A3I75_01590 [Deltaproteobacteria bacterium RIFCSPLOWO2_02_FULL_50_16]|nr:MAG: hypothetical protein A3B79_03600 [Deltaproteobacteria bacterium RIFCSPHIGHO2_02_FULL_50_15]OGQ56110.1 MAG: hypothetical protein A3I75_01590 [Deltaproteobacteria bacterium RIFCSPLOWO2_02_FULL_50_16]OGQ68429.1 MAG: hypothetical protein A3F89_00475 [Deltaproteobacteria bacterium RIFCSPLOWO2_12_FULL_50_11]